MKVFLATLNATILTFCLAGCDPVLRSTQTYQLLVQDIGGASVYNAVICLVPESREINVDLDDLFSRKCHRRQVSDKSGIVNDQIQTSWVPGGYFGAIGGDWDYSRDRLSGLKYLARVEHDDDQETLGVLMKTGAKSLGDRFSITVLKIGPARKVVQNTAWPDG
jgi:hypothetical protein